MKSECIKFSRNLLSLTAVTLTISFWLCVSLAPTPTQFVFLTIAVPSSGIPLSLQLVLACGWQLQAAKESVGYPWWTFGGFGVTFVTDEEHVDDLKRLLLRIWEQTDWDPLVVRQARSLASQQLRAWRREPMEWLKWQARLIALGDHPSSLDPEQPSRVRLDDISSVLRRLSRHDLPLLHYDFANQFWSFNALPQISPVIRSKFHYTLRLPSSQRVHGLWWMLTKGDPAVAMVVGELIGGGTGASWYQLLRGEKPIAYHAVSQVQWTPLGSELTLYMATIPENLKLARQRAQQLMVNLKQGKVDESEFERARKLAGLKLRQIASDPVNLGRTMAIWLMSGNSPEEWSGLAERLSSLQLTDFLSFCRSLPPAAEIVALP